MATSIGLDAPTRVTLDGTAGNSEQLNFPSTTRVVVVQFITAAGKIATSGTDGATIGTAYLTVASDQIVEFDAPITRGGRTQRTSGFSWYFASAANSGVVEVWARG